MNTKDSLWRDKKVVTLETTKENLIAITIVNAAITLAYDEVGHTPRLAALRFLKEFALADVPNVGPLTLNVSATISDRKEFWKPDYRAAVESAIAERGHSAFRILPAEYLELFFPEWARLTLAWIVCADPNDVQSRMNVAMRAMSKSRRISTTKVLAGGVQSFLNRITKVTPLITDHLSDEALADPEIVRTVQRATQARSLRVPSGATFGANMAPTDRSGAPLLYLRRRHGELFDLAYPRGIEGPISSVYNVKRFNAFCLDYYYALRSQSFDYFTVASYRPRHYFSLTGDYAHAMEIAIGKQRGPNGTTPPIYQIKYLPPLLARSIERQIEEMGLVSPDDPLFPNGAAWVRSNHMGCNPILLKPGAPERRPGKPVRKEHRWSHHTQRHSTLQIIFTYVERRHNAIADSGLDPTHQRSNTLLMDAALTGHAAPAQSQDPNGYYDVKLPERVELLSRQVIQALEALLLTDEGARKAPDHDSVAEARDELARIEKQIAFYDKQAWNPEATS